MADSIVAAVEAELALRLAARPAFASGVDGKPVRVDAGVPVGDLRPDHAYVDGDIDEWTRETETSNPATSATRESFTLTIMIVVTRRNADYDDLRDRAHTLLEDLLELTVADTSLGGLVRRSHVGVIRRRYARNDEAHQISLECDVEIWAQLAAG